MRYLGIDFGSKRIGIAISDESGIFSFPLMVLKNSSDLIKEIKDVCEENNVKEVIVGESRDFSMKENEIMKDIKIFIGDLKNKIDIPIYTHPEFLTSSEAKQIQGENDMLDASAAAIILKSYLDVKNLKNQK